jgi:hypothetical protein
MIPRYLLAVGVALLGARLVAACHPSPPAPLPPDASDAAPPRSLDASRGDASVLAESACSNLAALGCEEGRAPNCATVIDRALAARLTDPHAACLAIALSRAGARACGSVACPEPTR